MKRTPKHDQLQKQVEPIVEIIERIGDQGLSRYEIFSDWIDLMLYSLEGNDEGYLEIVEKYDNDQPEGQRPIDLYAQAFGELKRGIDETNMDLLGVIYEELGMDSNSFGQYFTPHKIGNAMASMTVDIDETREGIITISDPFSGSGRLLISVALTIPSDVDAIFYAQDKDSDCAKMTALNMYFFDMDGYAVHGDSLKTEKYQVWQIGNTLHGGMIRELGRKEFPEMDHWALEGN
ncbi:N-6 DNA methylase [Halorhabdus sp. CUG00001]|uniref:N-6 DNA methylase n=1 Tax=Halorhabdus sp. CUG00001 TaxID=2600297 RepID=UPI00131D2223|nr:N-6 DNA methylase [Halorhabdus sp. CUG00001]